MNYTPLPPLGQFERNAIASPDILRTIRQAERRVDPLLRAKRNGARQRQIASETLALEPLVSLLPYGGLRDSLALAVHFIGHHPTSLIVARGSWSWIVAELRKAEAAACTGKFAALSQWWDSCDHAERLIGMQLLKGWMSDESIEVPQ